MFGELFQLASVLLYPATANEYGNLERKTRGHDRMAETPGGSESAQHAGAREHQTITESGRHSKACIWSSAPWYCRQT